jgi:predicted DNA-binding transcriptional regulator AlpA
VAVYQIHGPDQLVLSRQDVTSILGVSEDTLARMIKDGRFPQGVKPSTQTEPIWSAVDVACWLHIASKMIAEKPEKEKS